MDGFYYPQTSPAWHRPLFPVFFLNLHLLTVFTAQSREWLQSSHLTLGKKTNKLSEGRLEKGQQCSFSSFHSLYQLSGKAQWCLSCKHTRSRHCHTLSGLTVFINKSCCHTVRAGRQLQAGAPMFPSLPITHTQCDNVSECLR